MEKLRCTIITILVLFTIFLTNEYIYAQEEYIERNEFIRNIVDEYYKESHKGLFLDVYQQTEEEVEKTCLVTNGHVGVEFKASGGMKLSNLKRIFPDTQIASNSFVYTTAYEENADDTKYANHLCIAKHENLIRGYSDGEFKGSRKITAGEAIKVISLATNLVDSNQTYESQEEIQFKVYIDALAAKNAIPTSIKNVKSFLTRQEFNEILNRLRNQISNKASKDFQGLYIEDGTFFPCGESNLLRNGCFEENNFGHINNWANVSDVDLNKWYLVQENKRERYVEWGEWGNNSSGLKSTDYQTCSAFCSTSAVQLVPAEEGKEYILTAWSKKNNEGGGSLYLDFLNSNRTRINTKTKGGYTNSWSQSRLSGVAPKGTKYIRVILYTNNKVIGEVYWDDVKLIENSLTV